MKETGPLHKNIHFNIGVIFTVIEGFLSGCSYMMIYLVIQILLGKKTTTTDILTITGILCVVYALRVLIYSIGYTQNQIGGAAVSKNLRLFLGDKFKRIPLFRFTHGQVGQYVNTMTCDTLRHFYATYLLQEGTSKQVAASLLGHADTAFLERTYCHPQDVAKRQAANLMQDLLNNQNPCYVAFMKNKNRKVKKVG